jgi:hypothetical protein
MQGTVLLAWAAAYVYIWDLHQMLQGTAGQVSQQACDAREPNYRMTMGDDFGGGKHRATV